MSVRSVPGIRCVITDLDDTFWDRKAIPEQNSRVAAALRRLEIPVIPATGRTQYAVRRKMNQLGACPFDLAPGIYNDGAVVYGYDRERPIHCLTISEDLLRALEAVVTGDLRDRISVGYTTLEGLWGLEGSPWIKGDYTLWDERIHRVKSTDEIPTARCAVFYCGPAYSEIHTKIKNDHFLSDRVETVLYDRFECAVVKTRGADKLHGVRLLAAHMGWKTDEILVIGDGRNDVQMLG